MPPAAVRPSSRHRFLVVLATLTVLLLGFFALARLPIDLLPAHEAPHLLVRVSVPGVSASVIEEKITRRLEQTLTGTAGVTSIESVTTSGGAIIDLQLKHRRDIEAAQQDMTVRLERAKSFWPASVEPPGVSIVDASSVAAEFVVTSRERDPLALRDWVQDEFARKLRELPGVSTVDVQGGAVREILVMPDQRRLAGFGLSFGDLLQAIRKGPATDTPVRRLPAKSRGRHVAMQSGGAAAVAALPVILPGGESISLSEIATVTLGEGARPEHFRFDGREAVKLTVHRQPRVVMSDVVERVQAHGEWMRANRLIPEDIEIHPLSQKLVQARQTLGRIALALVAGVALALFTGQLLLGSGRRSVILGVVIAASLQAAFVLMALSRLTLDVMTLGALALGAGLFGSSAILLFENGRRPADHSAITVSPVMAMVVALPVALLPVLFVSGGINLLFREFVLVFGATWLISALFALILVPAFDKRRRYGSARRNGSVGHGIAGIRQSYDNLLRRLLRKPVAALITAFILAALMLTVFSIKGQEAPLSDDTGAVVVRIQGADRERLASFADDIVQRLRSVPDWREARHSLQTSHEELSLRINEDRARERGIDITDAGRALAIALTGIPAGDFRDAEHRYDIRLRLPPEESNSAVALGRILMLGELENRPAVHLGDVASVERISAPAQIHRRNGIPDVEIVASPADGVSPQQAWARMHAMLENYKLPADYRLSFPGSENLVETSRRQEPALFGLALSFLFIIQALLHRSLRAATMITLTALSVTAGTGAVLLLSGMPLSPAVWLGGLILTGITAGQAAIFAASVSGLSGQDLSWQQKLRRVAKYQFRPLLVLSLVTVMGVIPLVFTSGAAAVLRPVMITVGVGFLFSLPAILFLVPALTIFLARKEQSRGQ
ncbi:efflux RND transporter permease subunit [Sulfuricaulis sp.]|jgi:multidrug efflux pump subunit AcrB|uniref:efflux RND transporter permease subunit n=1 Tax=Sulfuricaulis sp. TaxID=2003553 RepID=UPI00355A3B40